MVCQGWGAIWGIPPEPAQAGGRGVSYVTYRLSGGDDGGIPAGYATDSSG